MAFNEVLEQILKEEGFGILYFEDFLLVVSRFAVEEIQ